MSSPSSKAIASFHRRLHKWYGLHGRKTLPWRNTDDPYAIYVSEIMLQQTQVKTVLGRYYKPFLKQFPTLKALASAHRRKVLSAWEGLGYYTRAVNLHKAARIAIKNRSPLGGEHARSSDSADRAVRGTSSGDKNIAGTRHPHASPSAQPLPPQGGAIIKELMALPGIGRNTAHAIAAFAYRQPVPVMEANVRRVLSRVFALTAPTPALLWKKAEQLLDHNNPFDYNQAMMDLGAMICTRTAPKCRRCPAATICAGKFAPQAFPAPKAGKKTPVREKNIIVFTNHKHEIYASTRTGRFLTGLYHFTETEAGQKSVAFEGRRYRLQDKQVIGHVRQQYSHFTLDAEVYLIPAGRLSGKNWHSWAQFKALPKSVVETKILSLLP